MGKRIASQNPPCRKKTALKRAIFFDCFQTILRTCGNIRTFRSLHRRYIFLIEPYHLNQKFLYHVRSLLYDAFLQDAEKHSRSRESSCPWLRLSLLLQYHVTVKICFVETIAFSDQSGESVANHTVPYFFAY